LGQDHFSSVHTADKVSSNNYLCGVLKETVGEVFTTLQTTHFMEALQKVLYVAELKTGENTKLVL
jgi:hypothetical protein